MFPLIVWFVSANEFMILLAIFRSLGNVTPNYNIAFMGNSDSLYELSPGTIPKSEDCP
jgi:hypothetical protein